jgi:hypothetical protein
LNVGGNAVPDADNRSVIPQGCDGVENAVNLGRDREELNALLGERLRSISRLDGRLAV